MNSCHPFIAIHSSLIDFQVIFPPQNKGQVDSKRLLRPGRLLCGILHCRGNGEISRDDWPGGGGVFWATTWLQFVFNI